MLWDTVFADSEEMKASKPIFLKLSNRIVTVIIYAYLTQIILVLIMKSDCNGNRRTNPWAENKNTQNTKRELKLS